MKPLKDTPPKHAIRSELGCGLHCYHRLETCKVIESKMNVRDIMTQIHYLHLQSLLI